MYYYFVKGQTLPSQLYSLVKGQTLPSQLYSRSVQYGLVQVTCILISPLSFTLQVFYNHILKIGEKNNISIGTITS